MRKNFMSAGFLALCFVMAASIAGATTVSCLTVGNVITGTPSLAVGSGNACDVLPDSSILFSNFFVSPTTATVSIDQNPASTGVVGNEINMGFQLAGLPSSGNFDILLTYEVTGGISGIDLGFTASVPVAGGSVKLTEIACTAGFNAAGCTGTQLANITATSTGSLALASASFQSNPVVFIQKDIQFNNSATLSEVENSVLVPVPEPASMLLVGGALLGVGLIRRRPAKV
jgi:hypothetical protein